MKLTIPEISWHNRDPVLSVDFQQKSNEFYRLVTSGTDSHILIWHVTIDKSGEAIINFASDLQRHQKAVNCVRFSPNGEYLASCDDESNIIIWKQKSDQDAPELPLPNDHENETYKEQWITFKTLRGHMDDIYDLSWSNDSLFLISGSIDNTAIIWDIQKGKNIGIFSDHKGFVQGVNWDPLNEYVATLCSDRRLRIYTLSSIRSRPIVNLSKSTLPFPADHELANKTISLYYDDTFKSYFRRLSFSPDGNLIATPAGLIETSNKNINATYIFARNQMNKPIVVLPSGNQMAIAVRFCPILFKLRGTYQDNSEEKENELQQPSLLFNLPYRMILAVATNTSVTFYDTEQSEPFAMIANMHYTRLTDLTWSPDGSLLVISSTDGYCSLVSFGENELGKVYKTRNILYEEILDKTSKTPSLLANSIQKTPKSFKKIKQISAKKKKRISLITLSKEENADDIQKSKTNSNENEINTDNKCTDNDDNIDKNKRNGINVVDDNIDQHTEAMEIDEDEIEDDDDDDEVLAQEIDADDERDAINPDKKKTIENAKEHLYEDKNIVNELNEEENKDIDKEEKENDQEELERKKRVEFEEEIKKNLKAIKEKNAQKQPRRVQLITLNSPKGK